MLKKMLAGTLVVLCAMFIGMTMTSAAADKPDLKITTVGNSAQLCVRDHVNSSYTHCGYTSITMQERIVPKGSKNFPFVSAFLTTFDDVGNIVDGFVAIGSIEDGQGFNLDPTTGAGMNIELYTLRVVFVDKFNTATRLWDPANLSDLPGTKVVANWTAFPNPTKQTALRQDFSDSSAGRFKKTESDRIWVGDPLSGAEILGLKDSDSFVKDGILEETKEAYFSPKGQQCGITYPFYMPPLEATACDPGGKGLTARTSTARISNENPELEKFLAWAKKTAITPLN